MLTTEQMRTILTDVRFMDYTFRVLEDGVGTGRLYLQASYVEPDIVTGAVEEQYTRKWWLSPYMTKSEFVQTAFKCALTSMEHRTREHFKYKGAAVFGPHFDVEELVRLSKEGKHDYRS
jgi:hypothetical protein